MARTAKPSILPVAFAAALYAVAAAAVSIFYAGALSLSALLIDNV